MTAKGVMGGTVFLLSFLTTSVGLAAPPPSQASQGVASARWGTREEAKALVLKAAAFIKKHGPERGLEEVTRAADLQGELVDRDLYIFAYDFEGKVLAHGANRKLIGKNLIDMQDTDGRYVIRELRDMAKTGSGWVDYTWSHPQTKKILRKSAFVVKISDTLWIGAGAYSKS